ncbi:Putative NAD(P)H nitroreductase acg [Paraburkholderia caffeinitolerans]|uniref:NAD(P)H nitroreductase acg n=1 Tax=Paraburkholderia caffeinitolerans TaxID=1723730 RepID=A0A6J5GHB4_9BURK|nr:MULTISPECIES: nitroreductase [Paraburkholderia]CAB3799007.1 Putative NAD(P)H nitroreductase acg [Paraburkholderia caffeinitolerans]
MLDNPAAIAARGSACQEAPRSAPEDTRAFAMRFVARHATLAPSSHNSQPWRFVLDTDRVMLCADRLRALPVVDPYDRELIISCGAALFNLRVAIASLGMGYAITLFPSSTDPDVLAEVHLLRERTTAPELSPLVSAIYERVTTRHPFSSEAVDATIERHLMDAARAEGIEVACVSASEPRNAVADLVAEADRQQFADPRFRRELAKWIHPRRTGDGMPAYAAGIGGLLDFAKPLVASAIRTFDLGGGVAATHRDLAAGSPLLLCLATGVDNAQAWLATGQALERVLLLATLHGLCTSYLNQPIEVPELRPRLGTLMGLQGPYFPQLLLRIGHGTPDAATPRRPLEEVMS